eukprot:3345762-Amphidinium_carterae.1
MIVPQVVSQTACYLVATEALSNHPDLSLQLSQQLFGLSGDSPSPACMEVFQEHWLFRDVLVDFSMLVDIVPNFEEAWLASI